MGLGFVIVLVVLGLLGAVAVIVYNRLVALGQRSQEAWFESVKELAGHERGTFEDVVRARGAADSFPANQIALLFRFAKRRCFELDRPEDRQVPKVSFPGRT